MNREEALKYLDLAPNASADEIRERYLELLSEYDPGQYKDPGMIQLMERYTDELNAAYDALTSDRFSGASSFPQSDKQNYGQSFGQGQEAYRGNFGQGQSRDNYTYKKDANSANGANWTSWRRRSNADLNSSCLRQLCCLCAWFSCLRGPCLCRPFRPFNKVK